MDHSHHRHSEEKIKSSLSVKKAQGIISKVFEMIESDKYCPDIIQQIDASIGLLQSSKKNLLIGHLNHCIEDKLKADKKKAVDELIRIFDLK